jgi:diguanylate cyclase (GGDEF)-like protein/PAS domain S-box-containing protein
MKDRKKTKTRLFSDSGKAKEGHKKTESALHKSNEEFHSLFQHANDAIFVESFDGKILAVNQKVSDWYGYSETELLQMSVTGLVPKEVSNTFPKILDQLRSGGGFVTEAVGVRKDGKIFPTEVSGRLISWGDGEAVLVLVRDVTERKRTEQIQSVLFRISNALITTKDLNELFISIHNDLSTIVDTKNFFIALYDEDNNEISVPYYVDEENQDTKFPVVVPAGKTFTSYVIKSGKPLFVTDEEAQKLIKAGKIEIVGARSKIWVGVPLKTAKGVIGALVVQSYTNPNLYNPKDLEILKFVSGQVAIAIERKRFEEQINQLAHIDVLTKLPNRQLFNDRLNEALKDAHRDKQKLTVMFLDLDRFKDINDSLGHSVGDLLLKSVAKRLKKTLRENDTICRMGGDEFLLLFKKIVNVQDASKIAKKLLEVFQKTFRIDGRKLSITASIGIAIYPKDGKDIDTLMKNADIAMYHAKDTGRNNFKLHTTDMKIENLKLISEFNKS